MIGSYWIAFKVFGVKHVKVYITYKSPFWEKVAAAQRSVIDLPKISPESPVEQRCTSTHQGGRSFALGFKGDFPFSAIFYCPAATRSSKMLRKGNVKSGFLVHICDLSPCPVFMAKRRQRRGRGAGIGYCYALTEPSLKASQTISEKQNVKFPRELP